MGPKIHFRVHKISIPVPNQSQMNPAYVFVFHYYNSFNTTLGGRYSVLLKIWISLLYTKKQQN